MKTQPTFLLLIILGGRALVAAQPQPGTVLWSYDLGADVISSPALSANGTIYLGTTGGLCAITNNGSAASNKWVFSSAVSHGSPAIGADGVIYSSSGDGKFYAINPDGSQRWFFPAQTSGSSPAIGSDNTIYIGGYGYVYALTSMGALKWKSAVEIPSSYDSPIVGPEGTIYISSRNWGQIFAFSPDGNQRWARDVPAGAADSPASGGGGTIYTVANSLFAFTPEGSNLWWTGSFYGSPVVGSEGNIYLKGFSDHLLYALRPDGQVLWKVFGDGMQYAPATTTAITAGGLLYYCVSNSICAFNSRGEPQWTVYGGNPGPGLNLANTSPVVGPDGTVYAALGTKLYSIAGTNNLADSPWPMYRQNARHTGKVEKPSVSKPQKRSDKNFQFQVYAQLGQTQTVQASTDLSAWVCLTNVAVTNVPMDVVDLSASNFLSRYYRSYSP